MSDGERVVTATGGRHSGGSGGVSGRRLARSAALTLCSILSLAVLVAAGYFHYTYNSLDHGLHRVIVGGLGPPTTVASGTPTVHHIGGKAQNLLIIGSDSRAGLSRADIKKLHVGSSSPTTSTDTILIVHVPGDGSRATLISIPRDTYVAIPGFASNKINAAFVDGYGQGTAGFPVTPSSTDQQREAAGLTLLIRVVKTLTGLAIDHYVMVSFLGFYNIATAIHGVTVDLCRSVNDSTAYNEAQGNGAVGSGFVMSAGRHDLTPVQTLAFVRQRHNMVDAKGNELNDIGREARQRYFLAAAFQRIESAGTLLSPSKLNQLISAIRSTLTLDDTMSLPNLAHQMIDLTSRDITGQTIPSTGSQTFPPPVGNALTVDKHAVQDQIATWLNPPAPPQTSASSPKTSTSRASAPLAQADAKGCIN